MNSGLTSWVAGAVVAALVGCSPRVDPVAEAARQPVPVSTPVKVPHNFSVTPDEVQRQRENIRLQFEAAKKGEPLHVGAGTHLSFDCPHCVDPMKGLVPDDALLNGPAVLWN